MGPLPQLLVLAARTGAGALLQRTMTMLRRQSLAILNRALVCLWGCSALPPARPARPYELRVGDAALQVHFEPGRLAVGEAAVLDWIHTAAQAVSSYLGRFPVRAAHIYLRIEDGEGVSGGTTYRSQPPQVHIALGEQSTSAQLQADWVMPHELFHLGFPSLASCHHWMEEGLATYAEPLGRARIHALSAEQVWGDLVRDMPQGLPGRGDQGLDCTFGWGRTYWGGAMFWLVADVQTRLRSDNRKGIEHALRAIVAEGGTLEELWPIDRVLAVGDRAIGGDVLRRLYDDMKNKPAPVDLQALWQRLGVVSRDGRISFDERAPLSAVRRAITFGSDRS
jgi:hypothetical protein